MIEIKTRYGVAHGLPTNGGYTYSGIPYALPPVGRLRFAPPCTCQDWQSDAVGLEVPACCLQRAPGGGTLPPMSEDCLYLNVHTPLKGRDLPVAVWLNGNLFEEDFCFAPQPRAECFLEQGIVLVSVNCRQGVFGLFCHPMLRQKQSGNYGLLDQIAALEWVRENISAFGGDAQNVTLLAPPTAARGLRCLVHSPRAAGKFAKAILPRSLTGALSEVPVGTQELLFADYLRFRRVSLLELESLPAPRLPEIMKFFREYAGQRGGSRGMGLVADGYLIPFPGDTLQPQGKLLLYAGAVPPEGLPDEWAAFIKASAL